MNIHLYWRALSREHEQALATSAAPALLDYASSGILGGLYIAVALMFVMRGRYQSGFTALHATAAWLPSALPGILSKFGETLAGICLVTLLARSQPRVLQLAVLASAYAAPLTYGLKRLCHTARPPAVLGDWVVTSGPVLRMFSLPSGHTVTAFLLAACFSVGAPRSTRIVLWLLAAAVGFSRVWIGVHWPVDVLAGAGIAGLSIAMAMGTMRHTEWALGLRQHLIVVAVIAVCAVLELMNGLEAPPARLLRIAFASIALLVIARDYGVGPWLGARGAGDAVAPR